MKIERDRWYLRRDGGRMFVICVDKPGPKPIVSYDENARVMDYYPGGTHHQSGPTSGLDLIAPAPEPVRGYVVVRPTGTPCKLCDNLVEARQYIATATSAYRILDLSTAKEAGDDQ